MVVSSDPDSLRIFPFPKKWNFMNFISGLIDVLTIAFAYQCSYLISYPWNSSSFFSEKYLAVLFLVTLPFWLFILYLIKTTEIPTKHYKILFFIYLNSAMIIFFLNILCYFVFRMYPVSRLFLVVLPFLSFLFLFIVRFLKYKFKISTGVQGYHHINTIIVADDSSLPLMEKLLSKKGLGYKVIVIFTESSLVKDDYEKAAIILPEKYLGILNDLIEVDLIDEVLYLKNDAVTIEIREIVKTCEELGVTLRLRHDDPKMSLSSGLRTDIADGKFLSFINIRYNSFAFAIKKTLAVNSALLMIFILFPVFVIISLLIKLTSPGPALSRHLKTGFRGHQFYLCNFRTIPVKADKTDTDPESRIKTDDVVPEIIEDAQITRIGRFLRKSGLEELPQLYNVLKGDIPISQLFYQHQNPYPTGP
jgi:hypothetical protein